MEAHILILGPEREDEYLKPYAEAVRLAGGLPVRDWPAETAIADDSAWSRFLGGYSGVLFPGGADIDPGRYGEAPHPRLGSVDPNLDEGQFAAARLVLKRGIPFLAICRGLQLMGVVAGASLWQDLPSQRPSNVVHRLKEPKDKLVHGVELLAGSRLAGICGSERFDVNSRHHQAVREGSDPDAIGPFRIVARAPDGVIEGLEIPAAPFALAVQWHPENLAGNRPASDLLFRGFVEAAARG